MSFNLEFKRTVFKFSRKFGTAKKTMQFKLQLLKDVQVF